LIPVVVKNFLAADVRSLFFALLKKQICAASFWMAVCGALGVAAGGAIGYS
jgi:hypothetical protein